MLKYCPACKKNYDFKIKSMSDLDSLVCPVCHSKIDRNSQKPIDHADSDNMENAIGRTFATVARISYLFFAAMSIAGIVFYFLHLDKALYAVTAISVTVFIIQLIFHLTAFRLGIIFLPLGAVASYLIFGTVQGICLGICSVFLVRHLIRDIFYRLIFKLINIGQR